jgi:hypothetical protein
MKFKVFCRNQRGFVFQSYCNHGSGFCSEKAAQKAMDKHIRNNEGWGNDLIYFIKKVDNEV